ncbi:hypothetical protein ACET3Z_028996 [Daucus carota]
MESNGGQANGTSGSSSSKKRPKESRVSGKEPNVRRRGLSIAELERIRCQSEMAAAGASNSAGGSVVPSNLHEVPVYFFTSPDHLQDGMRCPNLSSLLQPFFPHAPVTAPSEPGPQGLVGGGPPSTKMSMGSEGCDLQLGPSTGRPNDETITDQDDLEFRQPNYFTNLLLAEDSEEETEQDNKNPGTGSLGSGRSATTG